MVLISVSAKVPHCQRLVQFHFIVFVLSFYIFCCLLFQLLQICYKYKLLNDPSHYGFSLYLSTWKKDGRKRTWNVFSFCIIFFNNFVAFLYVRRDFVYLCAFLCGGWVNGFCALFLANILNRFLVFQVCVEVFCKILFVLCFRNTYKLIWNLSQMYANSHKIFNMIWMV